MQQKKKSSQKKSLREQARIAGFHTRSIIWSCITMRPFDYSFKKRKMIETGETQQLANDYTPGLEAIPSIVFWVGGAMLATISLIPSGAGIFLAVPIIFGTFVYRIVERREGRAQKALEKRAIKVRQKIENKRKKRLLQTLGQN